MDTESTAIQGLIETFGSFFSCEEITSAYRNAGRNTDLASQILSFSEPSTNGVCPDGVLQQRKPTSERKNHRPVSRGTLSRNIASVNHKPSTEPLDKDEKAIQTCNADKPIHSEILNSDMEVSMRKMHEDGFKLDDDVPPEVLDLCGYNMQKEMESSVDLSSELSITKENPVPAETIDSKDVGACNPSKTNLREEILQSLFTAPPQHFERVKLSRLPRRQKTRSIALGKLVNSASFDSDEEKPCIASPSNCDQDVAAADDENDSYVSLLRARKEYRATMKEYYTSAIDAFMKGDSARAERLMEKGNFYSSKAREADDESERMIFKPRENSEEKSEFLLDLHSHGTKEAVSLLKLHLSSVSLSFDVLKVVIEKNGKGDDSKGARRRLVCKFLEKKDVKWRDGEDGETILIDLNTSIK